MERQNGKLSKYSVGTGDRFAHQAKAQLQACIKALEAGATVVPVWNKSNREHTIIGSDPASVRRAADAAVKALNWRHPYFCDADHITLQTVGRFLSASDFYTIDVADFIGQSASDADIDKFVKQHPELLGRIQLEGIDDVFEIKQSDLRKTAQKFLAAVKKAGEVYRAIEQAKGRGNFIPEISMDETNAAQSPAELLIILAAIADEGIPIETIAPKFSGRFNKGVDYVGDVVQFEKEFALDVAAIAYAVAHFGLPANLKLSVHSGSDKFSIYPAIHATIKRFNAGVHLKTAGTTWLEELIGLAESGATALRWRRIFMRKHTRTVKSSARLMRRSSTLMQPSSLRPALCVVGPLSNTPPRCAMCAGPRPTTAVCANSCMLASRSLPRWDSATSTCSKPTKWSLRKT